MLPGPPEGSTSVRANKLKEIWAKGDAVVNGWLSIPSGFSAEVMSHQGFDSLTIDMQHGVVDYQVAVSMLQGISTTGVVPLARVPWSDPARGPGMHGRLDLAEGASDCTRREVPSRGCRAIAHARQLHQTRSTASAAGHRHARIFSIHAGCSSR